MASTYKTPGVYIEEISTLPASIAEVETAIPAFIGYTETAVKQGQPILNKPTRIESLLEYQQYFGGGPSPRSLSVTFDDDNAVSGVEVLPKFYLYDSLRMFFSNGGGACYIVSVNYYINPDNGRANSIDYNELKTGLDSLHKEDEPTLLLFPDAIELAKADMGTLQKDALLQCNTLQDRFCIFDLVNGDQELSVDDGDGENTAEAFRNNIGVNYLKYGAAYYPFLKTTLDFNYNYSDISFSKSLSSISTDTTYVDQMNKVEADQTSFAGANLLDGTYEAIAETNNKAELVSRATAIKDIIDGFLALTFTDSDASDEIDETTLAEWHSAYITSVSQGATAAPKIEQYLSTLYNYDANYQTSGTVSPPDPLGVIASADFDPAADYEHFNKATNSFDPDIYEQEDGTYGNVSQTVAVARAYFDELFENVKSMVIAFEEEIGSRYDSVEATLEATNPIYAAVVKAIDDEGITLPPSGAIAGIYASVDRNRGVWKAPANVSLNSVVGPTVKLTNAQQDGLNVDANAGKSINAIRSFAGKGTLVWGARTLAGNDNEWRYVPVRRFYNMVEESVKKATEFVVFEPNDKNTWVKVKGMIESFLTRQWQAGALAGAKADQAFFVKIGLGETMTAQDILEGRMIVEIGMAAVRPAEFIVLKFSHKLQES